MTLRLPPAERPVATTALPLLPFLRQLSIACAAALWLVTSQAAFGATFYVDGSNPACDNVGPGTEAIPYCTINAAQAAHFGAGVTIAVKPGTYPEIVTITKSGAAGNPFVFQALGPGVVVNGSFIASSRSWIAIDGFTVRPTPGSSGIHVGSTPNSVISRNTVLDVSGPSGTSYGIYVSYATNQLIAGNTVANCEGHGFVIRNVTASVIEDNASHHNDQGFNFKIDVPTPIGNVIRRNRAWSNASTGFYYFTVQGNVAIQNLAWSNADHGIQHVNSRDNRHIGEVIWGNGSDGVSIKDNSTGTSFFNCILEENATAETAYEIEVDTTSTAGWTSNDNVFWNSRFPVIKFGGTTHATAQVFSQATGHDTRTRNQWARLLDPANGDFRLMPGSPAIDCANTSVGDWPATDFGGHAPVDDPGMANVGIGSVDHADRGAFEFTPAPSASRNGGPGLVEFALGAMSPNPIHSVGRFAFVVPRISPVRASVIDVQGRTVATLLDRVCEAGRHEASWDGSTASGRARPGLYFVHLEAPGARLSRRFLLAR